MKIKLNSFVSFLIVMSILISQVFAVNSVLAVEGAGANLSFAKLTLAGTTAITSDVTIGQLQSGVTIIPDSSTIVSPSSAKFSFTSDDGSEKDYNFRDVYTTRGVSLTIPVITDYISKGISAGQVSLPHLLELQNDYGFEIGSHTYNHPFLTKLATMDEVTFQLTESKRLMTNMGLNIKNFFVPYGSFTEPILDESQKYYRSTRVSLAGVNTPLDKRKMKANWLDSGVTLTLAKKLVDTARTNNQFVIFGYHAGSASRAFMDGTIAPLIDYIQSFNNTQVLTVDKALDRIENVMNKDADYKIVNGNIVLDKFFVRSLPIGDNVLSFSFSDGSKETITVTIDKAVMVNTVSSIAVTTKPTKLSYTVGDSLDLTGMVVTAYYNNNITSEIITDYSVSGYTATAGTKTITVLYLDKSTTFTVVVNPVTTVAMPTSVAATSMTYNSIKVTWKAAAGVSGYSVYRALSETGPYTLIISRAAINYTDSSLATGTTYYYKISAYLTKGTTKTYSNLTAAVNAKPVPIAPTNFSAVKYTSTSIKLTWFTAPGASGYELYRSTSANGTYSILIAAKACSYVNTKLITNTTYYYKVRAYSIVGSQKIYGNFTVVKSAKPY